MSEQSYVVSKKQIIKAKNMTHARMLSEGYKDFPGQIIHEEVDVSENTDFTPEEDQVNPLSSEIEDKSLFLRSENRRLAKLAEKYKNVRDEAVVSVYQAAFDAFSGLELPKIKSPNIKSNKHNTPETAVAIFSDWQMGKITPSYNTEVLEKRIELYTEKLLEITEIQRLHHNVDDLRVWLLGDIVEGEEIFAGQSHLIDSGLYRQVGVNGPRILSKFLLTALENFKKIHVTGIIGNHGAVGGKMKKSHDPETNMDRLLYKILELIFAKEDRITFNIPDGKGERNWYATDVIGGYSSLLIHGDQLPSPAQYYGYYKKVMGWKDGALPEQFDDVFMGHYHQQFKMTIGSTILRVSGSPESSNTYAQEYFSSMSRPCQHLMFIHPEHGVTSEYSVWLDTV
jgi:hypothetical protein